MTKEQENDIHQLLREKTTLENEVASFEAGNETTDASKKGRLGGAIYSCVDCSAWKVYNSQVEQIRDKDEEIALKSKRIKKLKRIIRKQRAKMAEGHTVRQGDGCKIDDEEG